VRSIEVGCGPLRSFAVVALIDCGIDLLPLVMPRNLGRYWNAIDSSSTLRPPRGALILPGNDCSVGSFSSVSAIAVGCGLLRSVAVDCGRYGRLRSIEVGCGRWRSIEVGYGRCARLRSIAVD